ncbi:hypothetical protein B0T21DRAFT_273511, partial [Apiosordaria backusii]
DLEIWDSHLRASLAPYNLFRYIDGDIPKPADNDSAGLNTWNAGRADIFGVIMASLKSNIWLRMTQIGWKPEVVDPRAAYRKVFNAL